MRISCPQYISERFWTQAAAFMSVPKLHFRVTSARFGPLALLQASSLSATQLHAKPHRDTVLPSYRKVHLTVPPQAGCMSVCKSAHESVRQQGHHMNMQYIYMNVRLHVPFPASHSLSTLCSQGATSRCLEVGGSRCGHMKTCRKAFEGCMFNKKAAHNESFLRSRVGEEGLMLQGS